MTQEKRRLLRPPSGRQQRNWTKIKSVQNTRKITKAMEMVAASKMQGAGTPRYARPTATRWHHAALAHANTEYHHPFPCPRGRDGVGLIVVTSDKLCAPTQMRAWRSTRCASGAMAGGSASRRRHKGFSHAAVHEYRLPRWAWAISRAWRSRVWPVKVQIDAYAQGKIGAVYIIYTRFLNTMKQELVSSSCCRCRPSGCGPRGKRELGLPYEPEACPDQPSRVMEQIIYQAVAENIASEQSAHWWRCRPRRQALI